MAPKYIDPVRTGVIGAIAVFPLSIVLVNILWRTPKRCYAQVCPELATYKDLNLITTYVFYAFLVYMAILLKIAQRNHWSQTAITLGGKPRITLTSFLVLISMIAHHSFHFAYYWTEVVARRATYPANYMDWLNVLFRVAGRMMALQLGLQFIPTARDGFLNGYLGLDFDKGLQFHRWSGTFLMLWILFHGIGQELPQGVRNGPQKYWLGLTGQSSTSPLAYTKYVRLTGMLAALMLLWVGINSLPIVRRKKYGWFRANHFFALTGFVMACVHASPILYFALPGLLTYLIDSIVRRYNRRHAYKITNITVEKCGYLRVDIEGPRFRYKPGQWAYLNVPAVRNLSWHPFSIASSPHSYDDTIVIPNAPDTPDSVRKQKLVVDESASHYVQNNASASPITFIIKPTTSSASWTSNLLKAWQRRPANSPGLKVFIDGPHGTAPKKFFDSDRVICVAGGSGIPGAVGIARSILDYNLLDRNEEEARQHVRLCWSVRDEASALSSFSLLNELHGHHLAASHLQTHLHSSLAERLNVKGYLELEARTWKEEKVKTVSVYVCGPKNLIKEASVAAFELAKKEGVVIRVHTEGYAR